MTKVVANVDEAVSVVKDGNTLMVGGFGGAGFPFHLRDALARLNPKGLTIVCNNSDFGDVAENGGLRRLICSFPTGPTAQPVIDGIERGEIDLFLHPQGTLAERIRAGGAGLGGFLTPTGLEAELDHRWEEIEYGGRRYFLVPSLTADVALVRAWKADTYGNLVHRHASRNFNPLMAMAAKVTIVEARHVVEPGEIDPNDVHVPSAFVDRVVHVEEGGPG